MPLIDPKTELSHSGLNREECHQVLEELTAKYGVKINESEMRIRFGNGSFIKLDGADNHQAYRGISPHLIVYDEYKDHHPKFHVGMDPNLATYNAPLIVVGTPPEGDESNAEQFTSLADYAKIAEHGAYYNAPTYVNPHISKEFLRRKKEELLARGEDDKWYREYMAQRVRSGSRSIFPMFESPDDENPYTKHVKKHEDLWAEIKHHKKDWDFFWSFDPGSAVCFAGVFGCINKYTKKVVILEEIYRTKKADTSTGQIFPYALKVLDKYSIMWDDCRMIYDNAAAWFSNEVADRWGFNLEPCRKDVNKKEDRLSLIKDMMLGGYLHISEKCEKFIWELWNYRVDDNGRIPKENDHAIDAFRYLLSNAYYNEVPKEPLDESTQMRGFTPAMDSRKRDLTDHAKVVGMEKSTHKIQYQPVPTPVGDGPTGPELMKKFKKMYAEE
jgi:hypothetical protein